MAVDLHTVEWATSPPLNNNMKEDDDDDFIDELTHHMDRFLLHDDLSPISSSHNSQLSWDSMGSPQSTLWSRLGSNQGSSEGSSQEPSPPPTPHKNGGQDPCWKSFDLKKVFNEKSCNSKYHAPPPAGYDEIHGVNNSSNIGRPCSYQSLIHQQIRAIELSGVKQEEVVTVKQNMSAHGERQSEECDEKEKKKGKGGSSGVARRSRPPSKPAPLLLQIQGQQFRAVFLGGSGRGGTGVFLPGAAGGTYNPPPESTMKQGKGGCSNVLIPARVVQALQQHFDQIASTSGPTNPAAFPPLHDVLVSNRDGMYSLQNRKRHQLRKPPAQDDEMALLPQDWTY